MLLLLLLLLPLNATLLSLLAMSVLRGGLTEPGSRVLAASATIFSEKAPLVGDVAPVAPEAVPARRRLGENIRPFSFCRFFAFVPTKNKKKAKEGFVCALSLFVVAVAYGLLLYSL